MFNKPTGPNLTGFFIAAMATLVFTVPVIIGIGIGIIISWLF